jgi:hypothetical protein
MYCTIYFNDELLLILPTQCIYGFRIIFILNSENFFKKPVTVAVRSEAWVLARWLLGSWVRIPLKAWMFVRVFLCCVFLCR